MRTKLNEMAEWTIFKYGDGVYDRMKDQIELEVADMLNYTARLGPMAGRIDISTQVRDQIYGQIISAIRQ